MSASGLGSDDTKPPRRFDLTMSRRTRRPAAAATSATSCHEQDHHHRQAVDVEGLGLFQAPMMVQPEQHDPDGLFCLSDHLQSRRQPELDDAHQEHETSSEQRSQDTKEEHTPPAQKEEECQDNSSRRCFSLQELIEDDAATTGGTEENAAAAAARGVREVAEGAAVAGEANRSGVQQGVAGRRVIGMMRRYVKVRSIKPKRASPEKNATPVC